MLKIYAKMLQGKFILCIDLAYICSLSEKGMYLRRRRMTTSGSTSCHILLKPDVWLEDFTMLPACVKSQDLGPHDLL